MRKRHVRNGLDFRHLEYSKIGLPLVESIQRIMIRAEIFGQALSANRSMEHPAERHPIDDAAVDAKPNHATRTLVHHDENPMCSQCGGFASEQIATPQTILRVAEKREPGWTCRFRPVMNAQDAANNILVDLDGESQRDLLGNSGTAPTGITPFHFNDGVDEFLLRSIRARPTPALGRKQHAILSSPQHAMEMQQRGRLQNDGGAENACRAHEKGAQSGDDTIRGAQIGRTLAAAIEYPQLMFDEHRLGNDGTEASWSR
jgi:hypothetical protein